MSKTQGEIIVVSDWKTGADNEEYESELQIGVYVLWALDYYETELSKVRSEMVYLTSGVMRPYEFDKSRLNAIEKQIVIEFGEMSESYEMSHFPPNPEPKKCLSCLFSVVCPHSMAKDALEE